MHASLDVILDTYVREGLVYYRALRAERGRLDAYASNLDVPAAALEGWSRPEQAAFWLNAYNAIVLRTVINAYPIKGTAPQYPSNSIQHVPGAFGAKRHRIGGRLLSLEDIEKQVLPTFDDPRMFFALGRGSLGGGRLRSEAFTARRLEQQLASVAAECVTRNECFRYDPAADRVEISPIFGWRQAEFTRAWPGDAATFAEAQPDRARRAADGAAARAAERGPRAHAQHVRGGLFRVRLASQRSHRRGTALTWISDSQARSPSSPVAARGSASRRPARSSPKGARVVICGRTRATLDQAAQDLGTGGERRGRARRAGRRLARGRSAAPRGRDSGAVRRHRRARQQRRPRQGRRPASTRPTTCGSRRSIRRCSRPSAPRGSSCRTCSSAAAASSC